MLSKNVVVVVVVSASRPRCCQNNDLDILWCISDQCDNINPVAFLHWVRVLWLLDPFLCRLTSPSLLNLALCLSVLLLSVRRAPGR